MKNYCLAALIFIVFACTPRDGSQNSLEGVWEYVEDTQLDDVRGMSFFTDTHFAFVVNYHEADTMDQHGVLAYSGTYNVLDDSLVTATIQHAHDNSLVGRELRWIHTTDGESATYQIIDEDGEVIGSGQVKRLE